MIRQNVFSKKIIYIPMIAVLIYTLAGFFLLPILGKNILKDKLRQSLNRDVSIEKINVNPYALTATIEALVIKEKNNAVFLSAQKISANLSLSSLFSAAFVVSDISLEAPYVNIIRNKDMSFNFSDLLTLEKKEGVSPRKETDPKVEWIRFVLKNINITQGEIVFTDKVEQVSHRAGEVSLSLPLLSSRQKDKHEKSVMDIAFDLNQTKVDIHITSTPFAEDLATRVDLKTSDIDVIHYLSYLPIPEGLRIKDGDLNIAVHAAYQKKTSGPSLVVEGKLNVLNADVKGAFGEDIIKFPSLAVDISRSDIFANQLALSKILVKKPELNLSRDKKGDLNLTKYTQKKTDPPEKGIEKKQMAPVQIPPFVFNLADFEIREGTIFFQDFSREKHFESRIFPINAQLLKFESKKSVSGEYRLKLETEAKESVDSSGRFQTHPVQAEGVLQLSNLILNKYAPYYESLVNLEVKEGRMSLSSGFSVSQKQETLDGMINAGEVLIQSLSIVDPLDKEEIINLPEVKITGTQIDIGNKKIETKGITTQKGKLLVKRLKEGRINLVRIFSEQAADDAAKAEMATNFKVSEAKGLPWAVTMNAFDLQGFDVVVTDLTPEEPVRLDLSKITIKAADLKSFGGEKGSVAAQMRLGEKGQISVKGSLIPSNLRAVLDIDLEQIDIKSFQPYFGHAIRIVVTDGSINTKGKLNLDMGGKPAGDIHFTGETSVTSFVSLDKLTATDFFKCNSLYLTGLDVSVSPPVINIKDISLTDFYSRIIVSDTGEINLNTILKKDTTENIGAAAEKKQENAASKIPQIGIESITLQGGNIRFSDFLTRPNFTANMKQITGSLTGLSSDEQSRAKLHLQGLHGDSSPLDIIGTINPLAKKKFVDIDILYKDIELANFTPYSSKYLGYKIEKGKLILDLEYRIDGNKLKSENRVRFDNFELGERVDSESATSLPVGLAVSLLKNRDGQIDLDLPVSGDLDDPEFKIGSIILKMIANLVFKVVTSPFSIIGSMFGGGEELSYVEFGYGEAKIGASNFGKVDKLAQILHEKPSVKLEIQGIYDPLRDAEVLREKGFEELLKAAKLKEMIASGSAAATLEDVVIDPADVAYYIDAAYANAEFPKPRDEKGLEKIVDREEKKKLLITTINIGENDLRLLSMKRSQGIKAYLVTTGKVEKEKIFLLEPKKNDDSDTEITSKVNFLLK